MDVIILAAGYSSRTKQYKMALEINGQSILSHIIDNFYPICENLIVVGGHFYDASNDLVKSYSKVKLVNNKQYNLGMFSSIKRGVQEIEGDFFVIPGDYPLVLQRTCKDMAEHFSKNKFNRNDILIPTYHGKRGHPILLNKDLKEPLLKEKNDSNLRIFKNRYKINYLEVDDRGILMDIDTMEDYQYCIKFNEERCKGEY